MTTAPATDLPVHQLRNIGKVLAERLSTVGVTTRSDLEALGAARSYRLLCDSEQRRLPVCYNLYSLEAALKGCDWRQLDDETKARLKDEAGA